MVSLTSQPIVPQRLSPLVWYIITPKVIIAIEEQWADLQDYSSVGLGVFSAYASLHEWTLAYPTCRYVKLKLILASFKDFQAHPAHFDLEVTDSTTIHGLKQVIMSHLDDAADSIALFKDASCSKDSYLPPSWTLERCGLVGGVKTDPTLSKVFYDYMPVIMDCPVLMNDSHIQEIPIDTAKTKNRKLPL